MRSSWGSAIQTLAIKCKIILGLQPMCLSRHTLSMEYCLICGLGALQNDLRHDLIIVHSGLLLFTMWTHYLEVLVTGSPISAPSHITCPHYTQQSRSLHQWLVQESARGPSPGQWGLWSSLQRALHKAASLSVSRQRKVSPFLPLPTVVHGCDAWTSSSFLSPGANVPQSTTDALWVAEEDLDA